YVYGFVTRDRRLSLLRGLGMAVALLLAWTLVCCAVDRFAQLSPVLRLVLLISGLASAAAVLIGPVRAALRREVDWVGVAGRIERYNPQFAQRLVTVTSRLIGRPEYRGSDEILDHLLHEVDRQAAS